MPIHKTCGSCGKPFSVAPAHATRGRGQFCSRACKAEAMRRPLTPDSFWSRVEQPEEGCWEFQGGRTEDGYGRLWQSSENGTRTAHYAHRIAWQLANGEDPGERKVLHKCDNPPCCRPDHLFLGTLAENCHDRHTKGRTHRGENTGGARLTDQQVVAIRLVAAQKIMSNRKQAKAYGVSRQTIDDVVSRITWAHLP